MRRVGGRLFKVGVVGRVIRKIHYHAQCPRKGHMGQEQDEELSDDGNKIWKPTREIPKKWECGARGDRLSYDIKKRDNGGNGALLREVGSALGRDLGASEQMDLVDLE